MPFPELIKALKRFWPDSEPIALNLKNLSFTPSTVQSARWYVENGYPQIAAALGAGYPAWSGESVTLDSALGHSVVAACNRIISEPTGFLPAILMQETSKGKRVAVEHPLYQAMKNAPTDEMTAQTFRETRTSHALLQGNGYAKIIRRSGSGTAIGLEPLNPGIVEPDREKTGQKRLVYVIKNESGAVDKTYTVERGKPQDILHIRGLGWDGIRGYSVIAIGKNSIGTALAAERNLGKFWARGGRPPSHIEWEQYFAKDEDSKKFIDDLREVLADPFKAPMLDRGKKLVTDGPNLRDSQGIENRQFTVSDICRWFNVSPHLVHDLTRATYSNIEFLALEFVKHSLSPWLVRWESEFWRCVLTPEEKTQGYYLKHNVNALLRGDFQTRMKGFATLLQNGIASIDEIRELEDWNPLPDGAGSHHHIQTNMGTLNDDGTVEAPQTGLVQLN